jgi:aminopeptidase
MGAIDDYARLVVRVGVDVRPGRDVLLDVQIDQAPFVHALVAEAYRAGAHNVDVHYGDPGVRRAMVAEAPDDAFGYTPPGLLARMAHAKETGAAVIAVSAARTPTSTRVSTPPASPGRACPRSRSRGSTAVNERKVAWTIVAYPTERWARETLGEPDVDRLWAAVAHAMRLDQPDPAAAWSERLDELEARARAMTERDFDAIRYRGPGTELEVGLIPRARWMAGRHETHDGHRHVANMPTEEVFTSPHRLRADGTVRSTFPLALRGGLIEGLELRLSGGEIVEARAAKGEDILRAELDIDDGARRLGELALVDSSSRVGETDLVFRNTLFDENAASHMAFGAGLWWTVEEVPDDQRDHDALNVSQTHVDFMMGAPDVEVDGVERGDTAVPLLRDGVWQLT